MKNMTPGITFAEPAAQSLLQDGKLDARWVGSFCMLPEAEKADERIWTPEFFRLRHFVSMYLPLRYSAWTKTSGKRNQETEKLLATLIVTVVETLWRGMISAANLCTPSSSEGAELVRLVLGADNPLRLAANARDEWERRYTTVLGRISATWRAQKAWPRWEAMALHFASFYLPLGLPPRLGEPSGDASRRRLLDDLALHVHADVAHLVGLWLHAASAPRDAAGIPVVDWSPAIGRRLTGRTEAEILLVESGSIDRQRILAAKDH